jgi:hypothetical protein
MHNKIDVMEAKRERQMDVPNVIIKYFIKSAGDGFSPRHIIKQR